MADLKLQLTAGAYDQPQLDKDGKFDRDTGDLVRRTKGETFEAQSRAEYDRLISLGAAVDPDSEAEAEIARLQARLQELESEQGQTRAQLEAAQNTQAEAAASIDPSALKGKELDQALTDRGLSKEGSVDEKRQRLAENLAATPSWA